MALPSRHADTGMQIRVATVEKIEDDKSGKFIVYLKPDIWPQDPVRASDPRLIVDMDLIFDEDQEMLLPTQEHLRVRGKRPRVKVGGSVELRITPRLC
jgi:hypothetical protein